MSIGRIVCVGTLDGCSYNKLGICVIGVKRLSAAGLAFVFSLRR